MLAQFAPLLVIFVIFYFLIIRPQRVKEKKHQQMLREVTKGDQVVTNGGLHGTIVGVQDELIVMRIAEGVKVEVSRSAIAFIKKGGELIEG